MRAAAPPALSRLDEDVLSALLNLGCAGRPALTESAVRESARAVLPMTSSRSSERRWSLSGESDPLMADRLVSATGIEEERQLEAALRPRRLADFTGQARLKENLQIAVDAARKRGEAMDHVLLYGPPGLGKTTLAWIIAQELEVGFQQTSGPVLQKKLDLSGILSGIQARQVFFIDEIHRLLPDVEEDALFRAGGLSSRHPDRNRTPARRTSTPFHSKDSPPSAAAPTPPGPRKRSAPRPAKLAQCSG